RNSACTCQLHGPSVRFPHLRVVGELVQGARKRITLLRQGEVPVLGPPARVGRDVHPTSPVPFDASFRKDTLSYFVDLILLPCNGLVQRLFRQRCHKSLTVQKNRGDRHDRLVLPVRRFQIIPYRPQALSKQADLFLGSRTRVSHGQPRTEAPMPRGVVDRNGGPSSTSPCGGLSAGLNRCIDLPRCY